MSNFLYTTEPDNADKIYHWLITRGGILIWRSQDLGDPGASWTTPYCHEDGSLVTQEPHWKAKGSKPELITDINRVGVSTDVEVRRFHVGIKRGYGLQFVCTDTSSERIRKAVAKAAKDTGKEAFYRFNYMTQEAVILVEKEVVPIFDYAGRNKVPT